MPRSHSRSVPSYRLHKPSGQAVVTVRTATGERRDLYLGEFNTPESKAEYARILAEVAVAPIATSASQLHSRITIDELLLSFLNHAKQHYRRPDGTPTEQCTEFKNAMKPLHKLYGHTAAADFGPLALKTVRQAYIDADNCRTLINSRVGKLKRVFKWAVENELIPVTTYSALATVTGLQAGRTNARESKPVEPVSDAIVEATLPFLNRHVRGLVQLQRLTGCRPGEAMGIRRADINTDDEIWSYEPRQHKTKHKGKKRTIPINKRAQELLKSFFTDTPEDYLFSPQREAEERLAVRAAARMTPKYPSHMQRNETKRVGAQRKRAPRTRYARQSYLQAIARACDRAFPLPEALAQRSNESHGQWWARLTERQKLEVQEWRKSHRWFPYQLRHAVATKVRKQHGLEAAQVLLGHEHANVTETYAMRDESLAAKVAAELG